MKQIIILFSITGCLMVSTIGLSQVKPKGSLLLGMFDGRTPCQELAVQVNEPKSPDCTKIKWRLFLFKDSVTGRPTTYELYGLMRRRNEPRTGKWNIIKGTPTNKEATVYQLDIPGNAPMLFLKADDNILFFLDPQKNIMVGNRDFSYTLNRAEKKL